MPNSSTPLLRSANAAADGVPAHAPAQVAKNALRRLAVARLEPTPENYARAYAEEAGIARMPFMPVRIRESLERVVGRVAASKAERDGFVRAIDEGRWEDAQRTGERITEDAASQALGWAQTIERLARALERGNRLWTPARKKESLQRVIESSASDMQRLQHRLKQLVASWEQAADDVPIDALPAAELAGVVPAPAPALEATQAPDWQPMIRSLESTVQVAIKADDGAARELAGELGRLADRIAGEGASAELAIELEAACQRARRWLGHRHHLVDELSALCKELSAGLVELAEDDSWARGQCENLEARLADGLNARSVRAASDLLAKTREKQRSLRSERERARDALKTVIRGLMNQLGELGDETDRFESSLGRYADGIEKADSLDGLADMVREMVSESRAVQERVSTARRKLLDDQAQAAQLEQRVRELESELRQLSDEVSTDALTQVANRRGLHQAFDVERARLERTPGDMALGLIDIDNFKKLNDSLGHAAGDEALKGLATQIRDGLRPVDTVARYGGEEFVVMMPGTPVDQAQQVLTRLQRTISAALFMHENRELLVTFSAGVTAYRAGETLDAALQRADEALYEAKRGGKNKTCAG
jgi:diguanylate cyclase